MTTATPRDGVPFSVDESLLDDLVTGRLGECQTAQSARWLAGLLLAGRILRAPGAASSLRRAVRRAMPTVVRVGRQVGYAVTVIDEYGAELAEILEGVSTTRGPRDDLARRAVQRRDDLESIAFALAAAEVEARWGGAGVNEATASVEDEVAHLRGLLEGLDRRVDAAHLDAWLAWGSGTTWEPPAALREMMSSQNPWWLDAIDPAMVRARRAQTRVAAGRRVMPEMALASSTAWRPWVLVFDEGVTVRLLREADTGALVASLRGVSREAWGDGVTLRWSTTSGAETSERPFLWRGRFPRAEVSPTLLDAVWVELCGAARRWSFVDAREEGGDA